MYQGLEFLEFLDDKDVDWILTEAEELNLPAGELLVEEGVAAPSLLIIQSGIADVTSSINPAKVLNRVGPGDLLGEISFVDGQPASASVRATESMTVLSIPASILAKKMENDVGFSQRLYRALSLVMARRLRRNPNLQEIEPGRDAYTDNVTAGFWEEASRLLHMFKATLQDADNAAIKHNGKVPDDLSMSIRKSFNPLLQRLNEMIGDESPLDEHVRASVGAQLQRELLHWILLTDTAERWYSKPRGYAGDFMAIEHMYQNMESGKGRIGPLIDRCFLDTPPVKAARNRRGLLKREIMKVVETSTETNASIASMACGPAEEVFDVFQELDTPDRLKVEAIDIDLQALAFVVDKRDRLGLQRRITPHHGNLIFLATGRQKLDIGPKDLIYSIGLIDYFEDKFVVKLMNYAHSLLKPGGKIILGNFHPRNPAKAFMDYILDWKLIHRTEDDMNRLYMQSSFGKPCSSIEFEEEGINLFAACVK